MVGLEVSFKDVILQHDKMGFVSEKVCLPVGIYTCTNDVFGSFNGFYCTSRRKPASYDTGFTYGTP